MSPPSLFTFHFSRFTRGSSRSTLHAPRPIQHPASSIQHPASSSHAFTLIELLVVIAIIGILAALAGPVVHNFKPNIVDAANRQLLDDLARARKLAISQRTTVYMVFVPTNFWTDPVFQSLDTTNQAKGTNLLDKQLVGYNFVTLRRLGDQPGQGKPSYLGPWKTLPEGVFIAPQKFRRDLPRTTSVLDMLTNNGVLALQIPRFNITNNIPFPAEDTPPVAGKGWVTVPYIAFNYLGQLTESTPANQNEFIPLTKGSVLFQRNPTNGLGMATLPTIRETPVGNVTNAFNVVSIDWLTGRAHLERQQVQ